MAAPHRLTRAPIQEAIIDIQCAVPLGFDVARLEQLRGGIGYSEKTEHMHAFSMMMQPNMTVVPPPVQNQGQVGFRFFSNDNKYIVQFRNNGMTLSRLQPYDSWETFYAEAYRLWQAYYGIANPGAVTRIAVRNINRLVFPAAEYSQHVDLFLAAPPILPAGVPNSISEWMTRYLIQDASSRLSAFLTQVSSPSLDPAQCAVILDIDVFQVTEDLSAEPHVLMPMFAPLRELKNRLFFGSLTEKAIGLFQ